MRSEDEMEVPTIADVAARAQVSTATVSRCLNSPERVNAKTREKVEQAIQSLGYTPNFGARALAANRTNTVGAVIPTMDNAIFANGLQAFQETLHDQGVTLLVATSLYRPEIEEEQIRTLLARGADGLLLIGYERDGRVYDYLARRGIATVIAWAYDANGAVPAVGFDNKKAMGALASEVLDRGHRQIGVISAETAANDRARNRVAAVRGAMRARGLPESALQVIETQYSIEAGRAALAELMASEPRPTAVLCGNDVIAYGALFAAGAAGLSVPGDVSITGFDDLPLSAQLPPGLTTVRVPAAGMGAAAADRLVALINGGGDEAPSARLTTELIVRGSTGPA